MGIDVARIKQYNNRVTECKQKVAQDRAEIEVSRREIKRLCSELSEELGIEVNEQNIEQIYNEHVQNIMTQVENGEAILNRIDDAENAQLGGLESIGTVGNIGASTYGQNVTQQMFGASQQGAPVQNNIPVQQAAPAQQQAAPQQAQGNEMFAGIPTFGFPTQFQVGNNGNNGGNTFSI